MGARLEFVGSSAVSGDSVAEWVRPSEWPALTIPNAAEQKVTGIYAVWPPVGGTNPTWLAMLFMGGYTVDWGDGSVPENFASNVKSEHQFNWDNCVSAAIDINSAASGTLYYIETLGNTSQADWNTLAGTVGLTYTAGDSFNAAVAGSTLSNSTGTVSTAPHRFATVVVTPQAGQNLTTVNLSQETTTGDLIDSGQWLDLAISAASCTTLVVRTSNVEQRALERVTIVAHAVTNMSAMFQNCSGLQLVQLSNTAAVTDMSFMFQSCLGLRSVQLFNTAAVTDMSSMLQNCFSLQSVPLFNTSAVTNMSFMLFGCSSLQSVPLFNTAAVTNMSAMFQNCPSLRSVPLFNMAAVTNMSAMFQNCSGLQLVPLFNTAAVTNMSNAFLGCSNLQSVPLFNTAAVTNMNSTFFGCSNLQSVPSFNTAAVTNMNTMFPQGGCLQRSRVLSAAANHSYLNNNLSAAALNEIYTNLATITARTITVTGNPGTAGDNPAIATAKGWTVTG